jgi:hypothetical protein
MRSRQITLIRWQVVPNPNAPSVQLLYRQRRLLTQ